MAWISDPSSFQAICFGQYYYLAIWLWPRGRFSQIWLHAKYKSKKLKIPFYVFGYILEPCIEIW
jgi:hypothetical protein